ncbi:O-methyltransferase [Vibrio atlanticus]|uniref:O-methyltransferase n=1 Tax=Vibrio atlanticus TaxID=693153 RepID=UPI00354C4866
MNKLEGTYPNSYEDILAATSEIGFPQLSDAETGSFLATLCASKINGNFLELGTGTGLCTSWLLEGMSAGSKLISVDNNERNIGLARKFLEHDSRVEIVLSEGEAVIDGIEPASLDLIFADTWPGKYHYLKEALGLLKVGGIYVVDDMNTRSEWSIEHNTKVEDLISHLTTRSDLITTKLDWSTGLVMCVKIA